VGSGTEITPIRTPRIAIAALDARKEPMYQPTLSITVGGGAESASDSVAPDPRGSGTLSVSDGLGYLES